MDQNLTSFTPGLGWLVLLTDAMADQGTVALVFTLVADL
jgi:hypothetical protein